MALAWSMGYFFALIKHPASRSWQMTKANDPIPHSLLTATKKPPRGPCSTPWDSPKKISASHRWVLPRPGAISHPATCTSTSWRNPPHWEPTSRAARPLRSIPSLYPMAFPWVRPGCGIHLCRGKSLPIPSRRWSARRALTALSPSVAVTRTCPAVPWPWPASTGPASSSMAARFNPARRDGISFPCSRPSASTLQAQFRTSN